MIRKKERKKERKHKQYDTSETGFKVTYHRLAQRTDWLNIRTRDIPYASVVNYCRFIISSKFCCIILKTEL